MKGFPKTSKMESFAAILAVTYCFKVCHCRCFPGGSGWPSSVSQTTLLGCLLSETVYFYRLKLAHTKASVLINVEGLLVLSQKYFKNSKNICISQSD